MTMSVSSLVNSPKRVERMLFSTSLSALSALFLVCLFALNCTHAAWAASTYYVNCSLSNNGNGTKARPWNNIANVNAVTLTAGSSVLFARGTTCNGELIPQGSGTSDSDPITITAYGTGALPIINGGTENSYTILLDDVSYYLISDLAVTGSNYWAVYVTGNTPGKTIKGIHLTNLDISAVDYVSQEREDSGLVGFNPVCKELLADIVLNGIVAHNSTSAEGINVNGAGFCSTGTQPLGTGPVTVENSTVHDVYADGILAGDGANMTIENNVVYNTGVCTNCTGSTPSGIWNWTTNNVTVQNNESYANHAFWSGSDGGDYDIDTPTSNTIYQYNYGHDTDGYCISVLGAVPGTPTTNSVVRYNICANNVQYNQNSAEIVFFVWNNGTMDGVQAYNNTIYLDSPIPNTYAFLDEGAYTGSTPNYFANNIVYSKLPDMLNATAGVWLTNNLYFNAAGTGYSFSYMGTNYSSFASYIANSGQDANSISANPKLDGAGYNSAGRPTLSNGYYTLLSGSPALGAGTNMCNLYGGCITGSMGTYDFFGQVLTSTHNIGAFD